jgi:pyruvate/2-oxoglutarate dehydrogenase complex dihydrolipoamide acyltransferase (E2) component
VEPKPVEPNPEEPRPEEPIPNSEEQRPDEPIPRSEEQRPDEPILRSEEKMAEEPIPNPEVPIPRPEEPIPRPQEPRQPEPTLNAEVGDPRLKTISAALRRRIRDLKEELDAVSGRGQHLEQRISDDKTLLESILLFSVWAENFWDKFLPSKFERISIKTDKSFKTD